MPALFHFQTNLGPSNLISRRFNGILLFIIITAILLPKLQLSGKYLNSAHCKKFSKASKQRSQRGYFFIILMYRVKIIFMRFLCLTYQYIYVDKDTES